MRGSECGLVEGGLTPHHEVLENLFKAVAYPSNRGHLAWQ
jgi:hypothetical protein